MLETWFSNLSAIEGRAVEGLFREKVIVHVLKIMEGS